MKILKYFLLFSIITCLIGCGKGTKVETKSIDTINGKYIYITYSLDKEYTIGLDNNFVSKDIKQLDSKYLDISLMQVTQYITDENANYFANNNSMSVYVDTDDSKFYNQCIIQIETFMRENYPNYIVKYLNIESNENDNNNNNNNNNITNTDTTTTNKNDDNKKNSNKSTTSNSSSSNNTNTSQTKPKDIVIPTIEYVCPSEYNYQDGKCIKKTIYNGNVSSSSCPDGYNYEYDASSGANLCTKKTYRKPDKYIYSCGQYRVMTISEMNVHNELIFDGRYCLLNEPHPAYYRRSDTCNADTPKCYEEYYPINVYKKPIITCPEGTTISSEVFSDTASGSKCLNDDFTEVQPLSVSCANGKTPINIEDRYYTCHEVENGYFENYIIYYCPNREENLVYKDGMWNYCAKTTAVSATFSCNSDEQPIEIQASTGMCVKYETTSQIYTYKCNDGDTQDNDKCIHTDTANYSLKYTCPSNYALTSDYMCINTK